MTAIEKEVMTMGNTTKKPSQTTEEFFNGYKEYKEKKAKLQVEAKNREDARVEA
ncbi:hypothetical protein [Planococcus salinus]|uniref:hypothetical protein n=1 Tax=Planococcus salinus TaxID=1848460 RepID=UPI001314F5DD|nr:hypothetical protein [Planococcus salinus]